MRTKAKTKPETKRAGRPEATLRWTANLASAEFGKDRATITKMIRAASELPGKDGKYSTAQIVRALFEVGGTLSESQRNLNEARRRQVELQMEVTRKTRIPIEDAAEIFNLFFSNLAGLLRATRDKTMTEAAINEFLSDARGLCAQLCPHKL